jgi:small subunit ribosomal protein S16
MVSIRLSRGGAKKRPFYHIVVTDRRNRRDGRYIERLGFFNPVARGGEEKLRVDVDRVDYWLGHGARPSERVVSLLKSYRRSASDPRVDSTDDAGTEAAREADGDSVREVEAEGQTIDDQATAE